MSDHVIRDAKREVIELAELKKRTRYYELDGAFVHVDQGLTLGGVLGGQLLQLGHELVDGALAAVAVHLPAHLLRTVVGQAGHGAADVRGAAAAGRQQPSQQRRVARERPLARLVPVQRVLADHAPAQRRDEP